MNKVNVNFLVNLRKQLFAQAYRHAEKPTHSHTRPPRIGWSAYHCDEPFPRIRYIDVVAPAKPLPSAPGFLSAAVANAGEGGHDVASQDSVPQNDVELLVRRLPALLEAQFQHERGAQSKHLGHSKYFQALCQCAVSFRMHTLQLSVYPSMEWLHGFKIATDVAASFTRRQSALPAALVEQVKALPFFRLWAARIPPSWGSVDSVFKHSSFGADGLSTDTEIVQWYSHPLPLKAAAEWEGYPIDSSWSHAAFTGTTFVRCRATLATSQWSCALEAFEWKNLMHGGGCQGSASTAPIYFKPDGHNGPILCVTCMYRGGHHTETGTLLDAHVRQAFGAPPTGSNFRAELDTLPVPVIACRAALLLFFAEHGILAPAHLPAFISTERHLLSSISCLIPEASKVAVVRKHSEATMNPSDSNRPKLRLNRLGLVPSTNGLIGPDGTKSVFYQVMTQMEVEEKEVSGLWLRRKRLFKVQSLAGEGIDDVGGGYFEMISHMVRLAMPRTEEPPKFCVWIFPDGFCPLICAVCWVGCLRLDDGAGG